MTTALFAAWIWILGAAPAAVAPRPEAALAVRPSPLPAMTPVRVWADPADRQGQVLEVLVDPRGGYRPVLHVGPILADPALEEAARSGLPLRLRLRVELWRSGFFDSHVGTESWNAVLLFEPLDGRYLVHGPGNPDPVRFGDYAAARTAVETTYAGELAPTRPGRYYYSAELEVETLSLSDLDELRRWLRGELGPAVTGERSIPAAVGQGVKRLLIRMLRLPARRYEVKSPTFDVP